MGDKESNLEMIVGNKITNKVWVDFNVFHVGMEAWVG